MNYEGSPIKVTLATLKMSLESASLEGFEIIPPVPVALWLKCGSGPVHISGQHLVGMLFLCYVVLFFSSYFVANLE